MSDYLRDNRDYLRQRLATSVELSARHDEAWAVKRPDHLDLEPPRNYDGPLVNRRRLEPVPALVAIGRYFRRARRYAGMSQQRLGDSCDVSQSMVSRLERGVAPQMSLHLVAALGRRLDRLFPLGVCPHDHDCAWQPIKPPERVATAVEQLLATILAPAETEADEKAPADEPLISVTLDDLSVESRTDRADWDDFPDQGR